VSASVEINRPLRNTGEVLQVLKGDKDLKVIALHGIDIKKLEAAAMKATTELGNSAALGTVDKALAVVLHEELAPIRKSAPGVLNDVVFWQWLALNPFREYSLARWCSDLPPLVEIVEPPSSLGRLTLTSGSVKSHARHSVRRLYIYAECCHLYDGSYQHLGKILDADQDIPGAVFERRLGLSPSLAMALFDVASQFTPTKKTDSAPGISARLKRREFFKQVNLLGSTVSVEFLSEVEIVKYLADIASDIP
jgi:hypothetical protein